MWKREHTGSRAVAWSRLEIRARTHIDTHTHTHTQQINKTSVYISFSLSLCLFFNLFGCQNMILGIHCHLKSGVPGRDLVSFPVVKKYFPCCLVPIADLFKSVIIYTCVFSMCIFSVLSIWL